MLDTQFITLC